MSPSDDNMQAITDAASSTNSCSVELTSSTGDDCPGAVISTNSCPISKNSELISVLENDPIESENKVVLETSEGKAIEEAACVPEKESEEEEQRQDSEDSTTKTQQNENSEADQSETIATKEDKETEADTATEETTETTDNKDEKPEQEDSDEKEEQGDSSEEPKSESKPPPNPDDDIEWLSPFSMPRVKEDEEEGEKDASEEEEGAASSENNPLKMLKKGAVAAVGGSMVGLGLVMIPLPTPFGAVVASSGLAVLGTEFNEAKDLNDRLIGGAKGHLNKARDSIVKGIEKMNEDELDADVSSSSNNETLNTNKSGENEGSEAGSVIKVNAVETLVGDSKSEDSENSETGSASETPPVWLHMNPIERQRQERLAKQKYRRDRQTSYEQAKEAFTKRTGKFLSKNLLPYIKKAEPDAKEHEAAAADGKEQTTDTDEPTTVSKTEEESESTSIVEKGEDSETTENETTEELEKEDDESCKIETNDNDSEGYVVVS